MAIIGLQRRIREVGRIRIGIQAETRTGKKAPRKLDRFRLTSPDRSVIEAVAGIYGGTVAQWNNGTAPQWEVITDATELRIALPPNPADLGWSQFYETWGRGFCAKRCDGEWDTVRDCACDCDPQERTCKATSRLSVLLPDVAGLGLWRLESHGYYAAVELAGAIELIEQMAGVHTVIPARLRLEHREVRRLIDNKPETRKFAVPVIDIDASILQVRALAVNAATLAEDALPAGFEPVPAIEAPVVLSVVEQVEEATKPKTTPPRKNAAAPIPPTGRRPRAVDAVDVDQTCHLCGKPYGSELLERNHGEQGGRYIHRSCQTKREAAPVGASRPASPPGDGDGGSPPSGSKPSPTEPPSVTAHVASRPSQLQNRKMHAMAGELWPEANQDLRRSRTLAICSAIGEPGLTSRADMSKETASLIINIFEALKAGEFAWQDDEGRLIDTSTGEIVSFDDEEEGEH